MHWTVERILVIYLKGTGSFQLRFPAEGGVELSAYADDD
jgi:hypothetical protein